MARYIDADAALEQIRLIYCKECNSYNGVRCRACEFDDAMLLIDDIAAADVAPKSEVAREIFAEIEDILKIVKTPCTSEDGYITPLQASYWAIDPNDYAELKKKYTEVEGK